jgi:hypothetical protein
MRSLLALLVLLLAVVLAPVARAAGNERATPAPEDAATVQAREEFLRGSGFVKNLQYAEALAAFERSAKLRPHAATTYNIGVCQRAMGQYTLARKTLGQALQQDQAAEGAQLSETTRAETKGFLDETNRVIATITVTMKPADAAIAVDGRPLEAMADRGALPTLVAGTRPPGAGEAPPAPTFALVLDPGAHVLTLSRKGFADIVLNRTFMPGAATELKLELDKLPATFHIASDREGATVSMNGLDVGVVPVDLSRPAGSYHVTVRKNGFVAYETEVLGRPGERVELMAKLREDKPALTQRWWFWTAAGVVVAGAAIGTYYATPRPSPERPALNGGGLGWTLQAH